MAIDTIDPLRIDELDGQLGQSSRSLVERLNQMRLASVSETTEILHLYANGDTGNDEDSGRTSDKPKKTLQAVFDLIPVVLNHSVVVHLRGTFADTDALVSGHLIRWENTKLIIDGGPDYQVHDDNGGAGWAVTTGSATAITVAGTPWTTDEHGGYVVEVMTGAQEGERRLVHKQTSNTITPHKDWVDLTGQTIRIVKPATTITGPSYFSLEGLLGGVGGSGVFVQRLTLSSSTGIISRFTSTNVYFTQVVIEQAPSNAVIFQYTNTSIQWNASLADVSNPSGALLTGVFSLSSSGLILLNPNTLVVGRQCYFGDGLNVLGCPCLFGQGTRIVGRLLLDGCVDFNKAFGWYALANDAGYAPARVSEAASGPGVVVQESNVTIGGGCVIENNNTHGIEVKENSLLRLDGAVAGTGNGTSGVYAHDGSKVLIDGAAVPTITGNSGTVELTFDGSAQKAPWATVGTTPQIETGVDLISAKAGL
jgi:hypothetical protein